MVATVATVAYLGLEARAVEVQVQLSAGLPAFVIVGLPDKAVAESRERVRAALSAIGLALPPKRITVNLSPADLPKEGSHFDLPIALCLLAAIGATDAESLSHYVAVGELSLDGRIAASPGVLLAALHASGKGMGLICPAVQGSEAAWAGNVEVLAAPDLLALLSHFKGSQLLRAPEPGEAEAPVGGPDLKQVKGQEVAKRALEIAAFDRPIPSAQALEWGLVTKVVQDNQVLEEGLSMLEELAKSSLHSFAWSKRLLTESLNNPLETQLELERQGIRDCARHPNGQEGLKAFLEKRKPVF